MDGAKFTFELLDQTSGGTRPPDMAHGPPGQPVTSAPGSAAASAAAPPAGLENGDKGDGTGKGGKGGGIFGAIDTGISAIQGVAGKVGVSGFVSPIASIASSINGIAAGVAGGAAALAVAAPAAVAGAIAAAVNHAAGRADELSAINPILASAKAQEDQRNLQFNMAQADRHAQGFAAGQRLLGELSRGVQSVADDAADAGAVGADALTKGEAADRWKNAAWTAGLSEVARWLRGRGKVEDDPLNVFDWWAREEHLPIPEHLLVGTAEAGDLGGKFFLGEALPIPR
jgi:hypothetical protein